MQRMIPKLPSVGVSTTTASSVPSLGDQLTKLSQNMNELTFSAPPIPPPAQNPAQKAEIDSITKALAEMNRRYTQLEGERKKLEEVKDQSKNAPAVLAALQMQVEQWREKVASMEASVNKYNGDLKSLDDQRVQVLAVYVPRLSQLESDLSLIACYMVSQMNMTVAKVAELSLKCGRLEKDCIRNKRENVEWQKR
jgi:chromosome segregation ATPase